MKYVSLLAMLIPTALFAMDKQNTSATIPKASYMQTIAAAQTEQGKIVVEFYFMQLLQLKMPNDLGFKMALTYLDERSHCDLPRIVPVLKKYINDVLQCAFAMRDKKLACQQTGNELARAAKRVNANINKCAESREQWCNIAIALKAYHRGLNGASVRITLKRKDRE